MDVTKPADPSTPTSSPAENDGASTPSQEVTPFDGVAPKFVKRLKLRPGIAPHAVIRPWKRRFQLPLKIADSYLLTSVTGGTLRGLCWFAGLLLAFAVISAMRKVVTEQLPLGLTIRLVACQLPRILLFTLPMSILYGTVQTFSDLSSRGELTALSVGGMSLPRMVRAPLAWGVLLAIFGFWLQEAIVPRAEQRYKEILQKSILESSGAQEDFVMIDQTGSNRIERVIQADYFDPKTKTMLNPSIQMYNGNREPIFHIRAERAHWDMERGEWVFYNGYSSVTPEYNATDLPLSKVSKFEELAINAAPNPKTMKQRMITIQEQLDRKNYEVLSISDLRAYLNKQRGFLERVTYPNIKKRVTSRIKSLQFGIHDKIATPLICIVLVLVGAPLGVRPQRSGGGFAMGISLGVLLLYYVIWSWATQLGKAGYGDPYVLAYMPMALTLTIGVVLMKIKSR